MTRTVEDPDVGSTTTQTTRADQLERIELTVRARKLKQMDETAKMVARANEITRHTPNMEG